MAENFIFTMQDLRKVRGGKEILKGIYLSFFPGAKIGVIGPNGAGKSTLLRIMAGPGHGVLRHAHARTRASASGFLPQEPQLDPSLDVKGNVELGVKKLRDVLDRFNEVSNQLGEPMDDAAMEKLLAEQAQAPGRHRRRQRLGARPHARGRDGRAAPARRPMRR